MSFKLPELPYSLDYLEPVISSKTLEFHYGKHHQAYVNNLNKLTEGTDWVKASLPELIKSSEGGIFNNAAQVWNHAFYWNCMSSEKQNPLDPGFLHAINESFENMESFRNQFLQAAVTLFGSGWAWLVKNEENKLEIMQGPNAWNPLRDDLTPLLTCDVWEHAYYLDYQNKRPDYTQAFWDLIDWKKVEARFKEDNPLMDI